MPYPQIDFPKVPGASKMLAIERQRLRLEHLLKRAALQIDPNDTCYYKTIATACGLSATTCYYAVRKSGALSMRVAKAIEAKVGRHHTPFEYLIDPSAVGNEARLIKLRGDAKEPPAPPAERASRKRK